MTPSGRIATELMKAEIFGSADGTVYKFRGHHGILVREWNPFKNPVHATLVWDKFSELLDTKSEGNERVRIDSCDPEYVAYIISGAEHEVMYAEGGTWMEALHNLVTAYLQERDCES